jgi:hypothetical protein
MEPKRTARITITRRRKLRFRIPSICVDCQVCGRKVETLSVSQAAEALEVHPKALGQMIADGVIHAICTVSGSLRICQNSLFS